MKPSVMALALAASFGASLAAPAATAADNKELAEIRAQIRQMQASYEARLTALEQRLAAAQQATAAAQAQVTALAAPAPAIAVASEAAAPEAAAAPTPAPASAATPGNIFNPNISLILGGTYQYLSQDPAAWRLQGFAPSNSDEVGPGKRGFNLGESELTLQSNIDPDFAGQLTFSLNGDNSFSIEEAFVQTRELSNGLNLKFGRFLSSVGYLNSQHAHAWDFVDAPLAYQVFLGGQYKPDGVQAKWLAPIDQFLEVGVEAGSGSQFPGNDRDKNGLGATDVFAHLGDDLGDAASYRAGLSYLRTGAQQRSYDDLGVATAFSGRSAVWIVDGIYKWAPNGNPTGTNLKVQGEYFHRKETGQLALLGPDSGPGESGGYASAQSGWYLQSVYQFMPTWRAGLRYDHLSSGTPRIGLVDSGVLTLASFPILQAYAPSRATLMVDYSPSEFSRLRLQVARDKSRPGVSDNQIFLQYIMSLGTHAAHAF
ncbi:hypothetical protein [Rugamonas sp.]|uniref:hypothetical protein n=1 Tax=Rugamonas sp. TaxID=1926287 RepID=UPI0025DF8191|nr:hypothetical protein [Rugamonas sp.]